MAIFRNKTHIHTAIGNPINKYANNFIFWNDFQVKEVDFTTSLVDYFTVSSGTSLNELLYSGIDQNFLNTYMYQFEGLEIQINSEDRYITSLQIGKIILNKPLTTSVTNLLMKVRYVTNIKNKATNSFPLNSQSTTQLRVINNEVYGRKGYTIRANAGCLPTFLYDIPSQFSNITKFQLITDQSADWRNPPGGDSGNAGVTINKNIGTNFTINNIGITSISWDSQTLNNYNYLNGPASINGTYSFQKFATKVVEKDSLGYRLYIQNQKYIIDNNNQGVIIDRSIYPYIQWSFWQFNGNPDGRFQELSYMFILGNATSFDEKEINRFNTYLNIKYNNN